MAYNADRRRQLWEQTARDDLKELTDLRALVLAEEEKADKQRKEAHARGAEVRRRSLKGWGGCREPGQEYHHTSLLRQACCGVPEASRQGLAQPIIFLPSVPALRG